MLLVVLRPVNETDSRSYMYSLGACSSGLWLLVRVCCLAVQIRVAEQEGIVFIDEIDKIVNPSGAIRHGKPCTWLVRTRHLPSVLHVCCMVKSRCPPTSSLTLALGGVTFLFLDREVAKLLILQHS